ncbi:hypothetical protein D3C72_1530560 [compost metagenome]
MQPDVGKAFAKRRQQGQDAVVAVGGRHADAQRARRQCLLARHLALGLGELRQRLSALCKVGAARVGEPHAARGAHEKPQSQPLLEPGDRSAHGRRRHTSRECRRGEAAALRSEAEQLDAAQKDVAELPLHGLITLCIK